MVGAGGNAAADVLLGLVVMLLHLSAGLYSGAASAEVGGIVVVAAAVAEVDGVGHVSVCGNGGSATAAVVLEVGSGGVVAFAEEVGGGAAAAAAVAEAVGFGAAAVAEVGYGRLSTGIAAETGAGYFLRPSSTSVLVTCTCGVSLSH